MTMWNKGILFSSVAGRLGLACVVMAVMVPGASGAAELSLNDRVECQRAIEQVYWAHTIWPRGEDTPKPPLDEIMQASVIRQKAEDGVRMSHLVEEYWGRPVGAAELQAELDRLVADTKDPEILGELFAALGNDPDLIAECLARPIVARRTALELYADDERVHGPLRAHVEEQLGALSSAAELATLDGDYLVLRARRDDGWGTRGKRDGTPGEDNVAWLDPPTWAEHLERVAEATGHAGAGVLGPLMEDEEKLRVVMLLDQDEGSTEVASVTWFKRDFADWWREHRVSYPADGIERVSGLRLAPLKSGVESLAEGWSNMPNTPSMTPSARYSHTMVWTGVMNIVWGGTDGMGVYWNGAIFNPTTDIWWPITNTNHPTGRADHTAVWTGTHMIVYGGWDGGYLNTGGRYEQASDTWYSLNANTTISGRRYHQAVWAPDAAKMFVWGGTNGSSYFGDGAYFTPSTNVWGAMSSVSAPAGRARHTMTLIESAAVQYLAVWGGASSSTPYRTGSVYSIGSHSWQSMSTTGAPSAREQHSAVFLGAPYSGGLRLAIWGGYDGDYNLITGGLYDFDTDSWSTITPSGAPSSRRGHTAVGAHYRMLVWGGYNGTDNYSSGGVYNHINNDWEPMAASTLSARRYHAAEIRYASTNSFRMMVWGGYDTDETDTGAEYRPMDDFAVHCSVEEVGGVPGGSYDPPGYCYKTAFEAFSEAITLSCDGYPVTGCSFSNNPSAPQYSSAITGVSVAPGTPTGIYDFWVRASGDGKTRSWPMRVKVMDYDMFCSPSPFYVSQGGSAEMTCTISSEYGFNDQVSVEVTTNGYFDVSPLTRYVTPPAYGTVQTSFTISPKAGTPVGGPYQLEMGAYIDGAARLTYLNAYVNSGLPAAIFDDGFESGNFNAWDGHP